MYATSPCVRLLLLSLRQGEPLPLAKLDLLVIDDFAISPMGAAERNDLLELLDDRVGTRSTLITSQLPVKAWHTYLDDPTLADAILDRIVHSSHKIELKGKSLRDHEQVK
jgi:DNA replication protein DnaC